MVGMRSFSPWVLALVGCAGPLPTTGVSDVPAATAAEVAPTSAAPTTPVAPAVPVKKMAFHVIVSSNTVPLEVHPFEGGAILGGRSLLAIVVGHEIKQDPTFISVRHTGAHSVVSFVRDWYHPALELSVPKSQYAVVADDGTVSSAGFLSQETQLTFHREARLFDLGDEVIAIWSATDLLDVTSEPPNVLFGARSDTTGAFQIVGKGLSVVDAPGDRDEPFVVAHPEHRGVMARTDNRGGSIELYTATLGDDMSRADEKVFVHSAFIASTSELNAIDAGGNAIMLWRDERHGNGILDPRPEMWVDTAWY